MMRILVVEDEIEMAGLLVASLRRAGFDTDHAETLPKAQHAICNNAYSLVVLDRRLPDGDGVALIPLIKSVHPGVRVMMLTALDTVSDKVAGLDAGADDYLTKPFDTDEFLARIRANLRRSGERVGSVPPITVGGLSFDLSAKEVFVSGRPIVLHRRELALLESLMRRVGRATPREALIEEVYGLEGELQSNALDALVSRLRKHLNENEAGVMIHPIRGIGYMLAKATA
jgi:two-component system OmpR family response regulator